MAALAIIQQSEVRLTTLFVCALAGFATLQAVNFIAPRPWQSPPIEELSCFHGIVDGYAPQLKSVDSALAELRRSRSRYVDPAHERNIVDAVRSAEATCPAGGCDKSQGVAYTRAIDAYLNHRLGFVEELDRLSGPEGARFAALRLRTPEAVAILNGLGERLHNQTYRVGSARHKVINIEIALLGTIDQIVPCGRYASTTSK